MNHSKKSFPCNPSTDTCSKKQLDLTLFPSYIKKSFSVRISKIEEHLLKFETEIFDRIIANVIVSVTSVSKESEKKESNSKNENYSEKKSGRENHASVQFN